MNFVFIIDTSLSMSQTFDNISYFDYAKSSIRKFVLDREINNYKLNRNKSDKYFLVDLNKNTDENFKEIWSTTTEHFLFKLNSLQLSYDFTNIIYAIRKSFQMINSIKKIGYEKHIYGRLFSKIQNSFIILITDGGNISSEEKVFSSKCNHSILELKDLNENIIEGYPNIYKELYRWDHGLYAVVLTDKNNNFESYEILSKICKNVGGGILTVDNPNSLNDKLYELSNKLFQNNRVYINFNINKLKKENCITYLEYNNNNNNSIDKMNEKWPFPDELIINKDNQFLPTKTALPFYEFGNIKFNFTLSQECYDEYDIKDKNFILYLLTDGECLNFLTLEELTKQYNSSLTIDILVSNLNDKKVVKKPFAVVCLVFDKELLDFMKDTITNKGNIPINKFFYDYQKYYIKTSNICNHIKCKFFNLPYYYSEFFSLIKKYKSKVDNEMEMQLNLENYLNIIPFYYIKYIIVFLEKNKIKKLFNKDKESIKKKFNENVSQNIIIEIDKLYKMENSQVLEINKLYMDNKKKHCEKKADCCKKEQCYNKTKNYNIMNKNKVEEDNEYLNFIENAFKVDKINSINQLNKINNKDIDLNPGYRIGYQFNQIYNDNSHESDIEIMGDYRDYFYRKEHLRTYLIPEIEIRYLIKDFFFGNQLIERKKAYSSSPMVNNSIINNEKMQDESIFHYLNDEDHPNTNTFNNNKTNNIINNNLPNNDNKNSGNINNNKYDLNSEILDNQMKKMINEYNKDKEKKDNKYINNKRIRGFSENDINDDNHDLNSSFTQDMTIDSSPSTIAFNDNFSESDGISNLMLDEFSDNKYNSKMGSLLIDEFKNSLNIDNNDKKDGINVSVKYNISNEKLNKWKFQKKIRTLSQELINSIHNDENNIIKVINKIIDKNNYAPDKKMIYNFVEKIFFICQSYGVNPMIQARIQNLMKTYS